MDSDRHMRLGLVLVLLSSATLAAVDAQGSRSRGAAPFVAPSVSTRTVLALDRATLAPPGALEPLIWPALRDSIVAVALAQLGIPYVWGGASPASGFDCSGFVLYTLAKVHVAIPRTAELQARAGDAIDRRQPEPGDLIAFGDDSGIKHVGIYIGNGKFVHASSVAGRVIVSRLNRPPSPLIREMKGARRVLATSDAFERRRG